MIQLELNNIELTLRLPSRIPPYFGRGYQFFSYSSDRKFPFKKIFFKKKVINFLST